MIPLVLACDDAFRVVRETFDRVGFTEGTVTRILELTALHDYSPRRADRAEVSTIGDPVRLLTRIFIDAEDVPWSLAARLLGDESVEALGTLGLVRESAAGDCQPTVLLYPTHGFHVASDIPRHLVAPDDAAGDDIVYPAVTPNTAQFLDTLPRTPCGDFLELCAGTGIAALVGSRLARHAWATDITARATHFAEFNRRLNGVGNLTALEGDLYDAVRGLTFDRIVAHPPYMPEAEVREIFRDGGEDGEQVTRRIIAGLPDYLRPGGTLHCSCAITDRDGDPFERRVRALLGQSADEFDVVFLAGNSFDPAEYFLRSAVSGEETFADLEHRVRNFQRLGVERIVYGATVIRRHAEGDGQRPRTVRRHAASTTGAAGAAWLLDWDARTDDAGELATSMLDASLRVSPRAELVVLHALGEGGWAPTGCILRATAPFVGEARLPPALAELLVRLDGTRPTRDVLTELYEAELVPPNFDPPSAAGLLARLVGMGLLLEVVERRGLVDQAAT